mgnify:CR=1 FL=1
MSPKTGIMTKRETKKLEKKVLAAGLLWEVALNGGGAIKIKRPDGTLVAKIGLPPHAEDPRLRKIVRSLDKAIERKASTRAG